MSNRTGGSRNYDRCKRRPEGLKVRWRRVFVFVPLAVLAMAFALGPYVLDLYEHPDPWNTIVLVVVVVVVTLMVWPKLRSELYVKKKVRK